MTKFIPLTGRCLACPSALTALASVALLFCLSPTVGYSQTKPLDLREQLEALTYQKRPATAPPAAAFSQPAAAPAKVVRPPFPNPYVSLLPKPAPPSHYEVWDQYLHQQAQKQAQRSNARQAAPEVIREQEDNNTLATAQAVDLDSRSAQNRLLIRGALGQDSVAFSQKFLIGQEVDDAIPLANEVVFDEVLQTVTYVAAIGDGPFGSLGDGSGDFDFYEVALEEGQLLEIQTATPPALDTLQLGLDPIVLVLDEAGELLAFNDDFAFGSFNSFLRFEAPDSSQYYVVVLGFGSVPDDVNEPGSGTGAGSEGVYRLSLSLLGETESDFFTFQLEAGDVFGTAINGRSQLPLNVFSGDSDLQIGANGPSVFPLEESPLPVDGQTTLSFVAPESGQYTIEVSQNVGRYELELLASRPGLELTPGRKQILFLDFTGAEFDVGAFFDLDSSIVVELSPFGDFLPNWGIKNNTAKRVQLAKRIVAVVQENIEENLRRANPNFEVEIVSDFGIPSLAKKIERAFAQSDDPVSRVIIGGTIEESGIGTIGIAQSIDPGNFATEETALVLLDILSAPATPDASADNTFSLNDVQLAPGKTIEDLLTVALGNITAHEAGHYLGNYHTDGLNDTSTIMDEGPGGLFNLIGVGPSGVFGAEDQVDVDFITDDYSTFEFFIGEENTQTTTAFALSFIPVGDTNLVAIRSDQADITEVGAGARLSQSYPNPQAPSQQSQIGFTTPDRGTVSLDVYDMQGNRVANLFSGAAEAGKVHQVTLDAQQLGLRRGVYIYKLTTADGELEKRIVITE